MDDANRDDGAMVSSDSIPGGMQDRWSGLMDKLGVATLLAEEAWQELNWGVEREVGILFRCSWPPKETVHCEFCCEFS